jgi:hypothetical protein
MSEYQCYGRADFACPIEESKDLFVLISELFRVVFEAMKTIVNNSIKRRNNKKLGDLNE